MKPLFKILTPTISTISIAAISLTSCGTTSADGYVAIPKELLKIEDKKLIGFQDEYEPIKTYDKLTVPKEVESVQLIYGYQKFPYDSIKKIDYESGSNLNTITTISSLNNLVHIVLPPKLTTIDGKILNCRKLNTIDISNVEDVDCLVDKLWIEINGTLRYDSGTLIVKHSQVDKVAKIKEMNPCLTYFEIKEK